MNVWWRLLLEADDLRESQAGQELDVEDLFHGCLELQEGDRLVGAHHGRLPELLRHSHEALGLGVTVAAVGAADETLKTLLSPGFAGGMMTTADMRLIHYG